MHCDTGIFNRRIHPHVCENKQQNTHNIGVVKKIEKFDPLNMVKILKGHNFLTVKIKELTVLKNTNVLIQH